MIRFGWSNANCSKRAQSFCKPVFFTSQPHLGTATDQEIRACDRQGKPQSCAKGPGHDTENLRKFCRKNRHVAWAQNTILEPRHARKRPPRFLKNNKPPRSKIGELAGFYYSLCIVGKRRATFSLGILAFGCAVLLGACDGLACAIFHSVAVSCCVLGC